MAISSNQYQYLTNMAAGKTSNGGTANKGQIAWAASQLKGVTPPVGASVPSSTPQNSSFNTPMAASNPTSIPGASTLIGTPNPATPSTLIGGTSKATPTPLAASAVSAPANTPIPFTPNPLAPNLTQQQLGMFDKQYGGLDKYVGTQNQRYNDAILTGDSGLLSKLNADASRVGYTLHDTRREAADAKAQKEYDEKKAELQAQEDALRGNYNYNQGNIRDNRVLEDLQVDRSINPFNGRKGYLQANIDRGRQIDDANAASALNAQLAPIDQQIAGLSVSDIADQLYQDSLNQDRGVAIDMAGLTGTIGGQQTLAAKGQQFDQGVTMANLTGHLPDGTPTTEYQQQQLSNLWTVADQTGVIPDALADMYGIPRGTKTEQAKEFAMNYSLNAAQTNASIANMNADNSRQDEAARVDRLQQYWKNTGKAPAGLEAYGVHEGDPWQGDPIDINTLLDIWDRTGEAPAGIPGVTPGAHQVKSGSGSGTYSYKNDPDFLDDYQSAISDPKGFGNYFNSHAKDYISKYGVDGYNALKDLITPKFP